MNDHEISRKTFTRRKAIGLFGLGASAALLSKNKAKAQASSFRYCLNFSTIAGHGLSAIEDVDVAGKAGYDAIEPWMKKLHQYALSGSVGDLKKRIDDFGMTIESAIGFSSWAVNDPDQRRKGFEEAKRDMEFLAKIGGKRISASPSGIPKDDPVEVQAAADRYRALLEVGEQFGIVPQIEMWGGHSSIGRLGTALSIAIESGHPQACFLGDVFHIYKAGSDFEGLSLLSSQALQVFHMNDYPDKPARDRIGDRHRIFPGEGIAPLSKIIRGFHSVGASPVLSLELFNHNYWKQDPAFIARMGLGKMREAVRIAGL